MKKEKNSISKEDNLEDLAWRSLDRYQVSLGSLIGLGEHFARGHNCFIMYVDACECMLMHVRDGLYDKQAGEIRKIAIPSN